MGEGDPLSVAGEARGLCARLSLVSWRRSEPSLFITNISALPSRLETKAMRRPSSEMSGSKSSAGSLVRLRSSPSGLLDEYLLVDFAERDEGEEPLRLAVPVAGRGSRSGRGRSEAVVGELEASVVVCSLSASSSPLHAKVRLTTNRSATASARNGADRGGISAE